MADVPVLKGIHHVGITVSDIARSEEGYGRVFGFKRAFEEKHNDSDKGGYAVVVSNVVDSFNIGFEYHPDNLGEEFDARRNGMDHLCFDVGNRRDIERWAEVLDGKGVAHAGIVEIPGMPIAVLNLKDPDGIAIELISHH